MWIQRHDGSLVNIEKFEAVDCIKVNDGYDICTFRGSSYISLASYKEERQVEEAKTAIFCKMKNGDKAMTMPYCITDWGENV